jgi:hypothetical protein
VEVAKGTESWSDLDLYDIDTPIQNATCDGCGEKNYSALRVSPSTEAQADSMIDGLSPANAFNTFVAALVATGVDVTDLAQVETLLTASGTLTSTLNSILDYAPTQTPIDYPLMALEAIDSVEGLFPVSDWFTDTVDAFYSIQDVPNPCDLNTTMASWCGDAEAIIDDVEWALQKLSQDYYRQRFIDIKDLAIQGDDLISDTFQNAQSIWQSTYLNWGALRSQVEGLTSQWNTVESEIESVFNEVKNGFNTVKNAVCPTRSKSASASYGFGTCSAYAIFRACNFSNPVSLSVSC